MMWLALATTIVVSTFMIYPASQVHADGVTGWESYLWPNNDTYPNVVSDCNGDGGNVRPDSCIFHITGHYIFTDSYGRVSPILTQCGQSVGANLGYNWSTTNTTSVSAGGSISVNEQLSDAIGFSISTSYNSSWSWSTQTNVSSGGSLSIAVPANYRGWGELAPQYDVYTGWLEIHYPSRIYGHYFWYYPYNGASAISVQSPHLSNGQITGVLRGHTESC
jgi:hypothetical protein